MKIYEIISESQNLNEGSVFLSILEKLGSERAFTWLSKMLAKSPTKQAIEKLTMELTEIGQKGGTTAIDQTVAKLRATGTSEEVLTVSSKQAKSALSQANISKGLDSFAKVSGTGWKTIESGLTLWGVGKPIYDCADGIADAYARNAAGDPEYQGAKLQGAIQIYLDRAVAQILSLWAGRTLVKIVASMPKNFFSAFYNGPLLDKAYSGLTKAGQTAFTAWMVSPQGQKAFAEWIVGSSFTGSTMRGLSSWVGGWAKSVYDVIANKAATGEKATSVEQPTDAADTAPPAAAPVAQSEYDPLTGGRLK